MKKIISSFILILLTGTISYAQVAIATFNTTPSSSAMLQVISTTKGLLAPRMTFSQRNAIATPASGLMVICTDCSVDGTEVVSIFLGGKWQNIADTCDVPVIPTEGFHINSSSQIIWNWTAVPIATGYKWGSTNNFASATDMGTAITKTETGLAFPGSYTRYVWAYNACGNSDPVILTSETFTCGFPITRTHTAGDVAPVTKTVTYGTVTNIPGEPSKCWITSNLGASQQAGSKSDNSEASAGWYWQFNRKQGYKHDGTTRTPNTDWESFFEESSWVSANDPCLLLLGNNWRIPNHGEWLHVNDAGGWTNWDGPWDSDLKLHAAGYLNSSSGNLSSRGTTGRYWTSTRDYHAFFTDRNGIFLEFNSTSSDILFDRKTFGMTLRCIRTD